jgi:ParB family chromosome partitioning protein
MNRLALGRGLDALIPVTPAGAEKHSGIVTIPIDQVIPNPLQPRTQLDGVKLHELSESIREHGVLQPIIVKRVGEQFQLIAGERRWSAAKTAGLTDIPAIIPEASTPEAELEWALIENLQREDLNVLDEAAGYQKLATLFGYTQEAIAARVGKDRSTVANTLRLLSLPEAVREKVSATRITAGHARALLALPSAAEQVKLANRIVSESLSVRRTEEIVYGRPKRVLSRAKKRSPELEAVEQSLRRRLGATVHIIESKKRGRIIVDYYGHADLNRILELMGAA